jgi:hypothetical protein
VREESVGSEERAEDERRVQRAIDRAMAAMMRATAKRLSPQLAMTREQLLAEAAELEEGARE